MRTVYTTCQICVTTCGLKVTVTDDNRVERIAPDKDNPYSWHDFCGKGRTAHELVEHPRRITSPMKRVGDRYVPATWAEAIDDISRRLRTIVASNGPDAVGMYWGNPAGMSAASNALFATGFLDALGTHSRYYPGSVDENNFHVVCEAMYGAPFLCLVPDVDEAECFLLIGMNPAVSAFNWVFNVPGGWRRVLERQKQGADLIVVDPVRTLTAEKANTHLAIRPGQDWAFLLGVLKVIFAENLEDSGACERLTGLDAVRAIAADADLGDLAARCDIPAAHIADVARRFATARTGFCDTHTGVAQNTTGTVGEWFSHLLNHVTGRIDRPGGRRVEPGYVDVNGLWQKMAKPLEGRSRVRRLPAVNGYHALAELADEITTPGPGQIRAVILDAGNPVVSGPDGAKLDRALESLDLLVAIDLVQRESHRHAHWLIPGIHWLERDDLWWLGAQFQDQPFVQYHHRAVDPPPDAKAEWEFFIDLALAMKVPMFGRKGVNTFIRTTHALAKLTGKPALAFHPRWIDRLMVTIGRRVKWKDIMSNPHGLIYGQKEYSHFAKVLNTPDQRVNAAPAAFVAEARRLLATPAPSTTAEFPLLLVGARHKHSINSHINDLPGLHRGHRHNNAVIHPDDAAGAEISSGDIVRVSSRSGSVELPAEVSDRIRPGVVSIPHGWGSRVFDPAGSADPLGYGANVNLLVTDAELDPLSQTTPFNSEAVRVELASSAPGDEIDSEGDRVVSG